MQVGTTKDQGLYNKPSAAVHPEALAAGTLPQYNTSCCKVSVTQNIREKADKQRGGVPSVTGSNKVYQQRYE